MRGRATHLPEKSQLRNIPLFAAQLDLKSTSDHVGRNEALKAMEKHGVDKEHLAWISTLWEQHSLQVRLGHLTSKQFKTKRGLLQVASERKPNGVHNSHSAGNPEQKMGGESKKMIRFPSG